MLKFVFSCLLTIRTEHIDTLPHLFLMILAFDTPLHAHFPSGFFQDRLIGDFRVIRILLGPKISAFNQIIQSALSFFLDFGTGFSLQSILRGKFG